MMEMEERHKEAIIKYLLDNLKFKTLDKLLTGDFKEKLQIPLDDYLTKKAQLKDAFPEFVYRSFVDAGEQGRIALCVVLEKADKKLLQKVNSKFLRNLNPGATLSMTEDISSVPSVVDNADAGNTLVSDSSPFSTSTRRTGNTKKWSNPSYGDPKEKAEQLGEESDPYSGIKKKVVDVIKATEYRGPPKVQNAYVICSKFKGLVLIINNEKFDNTYEFRHGSRVDEHCLKQLFEGLDFEVIIKRNLTRKNMIATIYEFSSDERHREADMSVICILSHGKDNNIVVSSDCNDIHLEKDVYGKMNNEFCPALKDKPKLFIIQACRGDETDHGVKEDSVTTDAQVFTKSQPEKRTVSSYDMLICYATIPGYVALRDTVDGTWFVQTICKVFGEYAHDTDLRDMMDMVSNDVKNNKNGDFFETCTYEVRGFTKKLYFNPGFSMDKQELLKSIDQKTPLSLARKKTQSECDFLAAKDVAPEYTGSAPPRKEKSKKFSFSSLRNPFSSKKDRKPIPDMNTK